MVVIKSYKNGIALHLNDEDDINVILDEIAEKFEESRKYFKDAALAISIEDRSVTTEEEKAIIQTIEAHSDVNIICIVGKNENTDRKFVKALKRVEVQNEESIGRFYKGDVLDGEVLECEGTLVVYGNVETGGLVAARKDIIVLGSLEGDAYADLKKEGGHFIAAVKMAPHSCTIGGIALKSGGSKGLFDKRKNVPCVIYSKNGELVSDVLTPGIIENATTIQA
ncbi:MAG: septum site-determining protein MinC [Lachnospiraceae bacterium]|nr:septum site-determining protein MinC [Lachnospiraceae bacterium]